MKVKEHLGDVLKQIMEAEDTMAVMEIIDNSEALNAEMPETVEGDGGGEWEQKYNDLMEKFKTRFLEELSGGSADENLDDEVDEVVEEETDEKDFGSMSYEEAGIK